MASRTNTSDISGLSTVFDGGEAGSSIPPATSEPHRVPEPGLYDHTSSTGLKNEPVFQTFVISVDRFRATVQVSNSLYLFHSTYRCQQPVAVWKQRTPIPSESTGSTETRRLAVFKPCAPNEGTPSTEPVRQSMCIPRTTLGYAPRGANTARPLERGKFSSHSLCEFDNETCLSLLCFWSSDLRPFADTRRDHTYICSHVRTRPSGLIVDVYSRPLVTKLGYAPLGDKQVRRHPEVAHKGTSCA